tara:strand:+ start:509 stop:718 length:210 start_codon:yes stop_codon:yes gene_type:complete
MEKIKGFYTNEAEEASTELDDVVEQMIITMKLKGQEQLYAFDVTKDIYLRNLILSTMGEEYDEKVQEEN